MASGFGLKGGKWIVDRGDILPYTKDTDTRTSRCHPFWQELLACYVINTSADDISGGKKCQPAFENYFECLNHKKEHARAVAMQSAYRKRMAQSDYEQPNPDVIRNLGLLDRQEDTEKVLSLNKK